MKTYAEKILLALAGLKARVRVYDAKLNGTAPRFEDSRPPTGDDYNRLYSVVMSALVAIESIEKPRRAMLTWNAENATDLAHELRTISKSGIVILSVEPHPAPSKMWSYTFELEKARAKELLGYEPGAGEWSDWEGHQVPEVEPVPAVPELVYPAPPPAGQMWVNLGDRMELRTVAEHQVAHQGGGNWKPHSFLIRSPQTDEGEQVFWTLGSDVPIIVKT